MLHELKTFSVLMQGCSVDDADRSLNKHEKLF